MGDVKNIGRADVRKVKMKPICSCIKQIPCAALWHKTAVLGFPGFKSCEDNTQRLEKHMLLLRKLSSVCSGSTFRGVSILD